MNIPHSIQRIHFSYRTSFAAAILGLAIIGVSGCASYDDRPAYASATYSSPGVELQISTEADFYEPLAPYGEWVVIGSYGRCWRPHVRESEWRPYSDGHWEWTDAGWYWVSDEPWGWATCHYGRWDQDDSGWFWVPQTHWAPAWVEWREGDGYVGWAAIPPSGHVSTSRPRAYVFVEEKRFVEPVRPTTIIVNNTTIINRTANVTNTRVVNNTVVNQGPRPEVVEQHTGRRVAPVPVHQVRAREEAKIEHRPRSAPTAAREAPRANTSVQPPTNERPKPTQRPQPGAYTKTAPEQRRDEKQPKAETRRTPQPEPDRASAERAAQERERAAASRAASERAAADRERAEQAQKERATTERREADRVTKERAERERAASERNEKERMANERAASEKNRNERAKAERGEQEKAQNERSNASHAAKAEPNAPQPEHAGNQPKQLPPKKKIKPNERRPNQGEQEREDGKKSPDQQ